MGVSGVLSMCIIGAGLLWLVVLIIVRRRRYQKALKLRNEALERYQEDVALRQRNYERSQEEAVRSCEIDGTDADESVGWGINSVKYLTKGESSEVDLVYLLTQSGIPASTIFHDLYVKKIGDEYTQIDVVVPTNVGMLVFEVKDYSGWIFGDATKEKWTQVLAYGQEKHQFYNPLKQNEGHINALRGTLEQLQRIPFFSIVVFFGNSKIRSLTNVPYQSYVIYPNEVESLVKRILSSYPPAPYTNKWAVMDMLTAAVQNGEREDIVSLHTNRVKARYAHKYESSYSYKAPSFRYYRKWRRWY